MKKKTAILILGLAVALSVGACGTKDNLTESEETTNAIADVQETEKQDYETEEVETQEIETQIEETEEVKLWEKVGIKDGIGTVYNGETVELDDSLSGSYEFFKPASFLQFTQADISYDDVNIKLWVSENTDVCRISLSGKYELREDTESMDRAYIIVDGKKIGLVTMGASNAVEALNEGKEDCYVYNFQLYPTDGVILNGYEFKDCQMSNVVDWFGDPYSISYAVNQITYNYKIQDSAFGYDKASGTWSPFGSHSSYIFNTKDGKTIESIDIQLEYAEKAVRIHEQSCGRYYAGDNIELKQVFIDWDENKEDIFGDIKFKVGEINGDTLSAFISITNLSGVTDKEIDFIVWNNLICYIYDEDYINLNYEITYNPSDNDEYDYMLSFKIKDIEKATYLRFAGHWLDDNSSNKYMYEVMVKLK